MNKPYGVIVFGANGSGKTTFGRELARILNFKCMDHEDYAFMESEIPYANPRSRDECIKLMLADIEKHRSFVLSAVTGDFGDIIPQFYELAVYISAPLELRMERIKRRSYEQYGERVLKGGDMYEQETKFFDFAANRPLSRIEQWAETLVCPVIRIDGAEDWRTNVADIADKIMTRRHYDSLTDENNDPVHDPEPLKIHMNKWDGEPFIEELKLSLDKSALEIGVGTGRLAERVCGRCRSFTGIDISPKTIQRARENLRDHSDIHLICGDFLTYAFNRSFDVIYSSLTFMHIKYKRAAIQKAVALLNYEGRFVLSISKDQQTSIDFGDRKINIYPDSPEEINSLLIQTGLSVEKQFETEFAVIFTARKR